MSDHCETMIDRHLTRNSNCEVLRKCAKAVLLAKSRRVPFLNSITTVATLFVFAILCNFGAIVAQGQVSPVYVPEGARRDLDFAESGPSALLALPTVTVRGFLNFRTTVDGTVIVFTPASEAPSVEPSRAQLDAGTPSTTRAPEAGQPNNIQDIGFSQNNQDPLLVKKTSGVSEQKDAGRIETLRDFNAVIPSSENVFLIKSKVQPTTTSQPTPVVKPVKTEPTLLQPTVTQSETATGGGQYPTGLVTVLGGTNVEKGTTTIHETKVIGTYIDGKYAQILQSTSRVIGGSKPTNKPIVSSPPSTSSFTRSIQPTPSTPKSSQVVRTSSPNSFVASRSGPNREKNNQVASSTSTFPRTRTDNKPLSNNNLRRGDDAITGNTVLQSSFRIPNGGENPQRASSVATQALESAGVHSNRFSNKNERVRPTSVIEDDNTLVNLNNARRNQTNSSARLRYQLPRRQSHTVRLNRFKVKLTVRPEQIGAASEDEHHTSKNQFDDENESEHKPEAGSFDPNNVVFEKATITSEITIHVGRRKSVRTITITTSVPKSGGEASEVDSNNIALQRPVIDPTEAAANDALIAATTPPNALSGSLPASGEETPPLIISRNKRTDLITISRTYSTTERVWRTSVVPYVDGETTTSHTVTENFIIRKIITAYKTMPPHDETGEETDNVDPLPTLDSNQNYQTALLQGAIPLPPSPQQQLLLQTPSPQQQQLQQQQQQQQHQQQQLLNLQTSGGLNSPYLQLASSGTMPLDQLGNNPLLSLSAALSQNPLAAVYLGLHQLNRQVTQYSTVTKSSEYTTTETVYSTRVVRLYDGRQTRFRTLSEPISTTEKVVTSYTTTVEPYINTQALQQQQQLQQLIGNTQLVPIPTIQPQKTSTVTSSYTTVTTGTSYSTKIYTLIYNAFSTKFRTVTSTSTYPTTITTFSTSEFIVRTPASAAPALPIIPPQPVPVPVPQAPPVAAPAPVAPVPVPVPIATTVQPAPLPTTQA